MTNSDSTRFNSLYCSLKENERDIFKDITLRLLKVNFLLRITDNDRYLFINNHRELFELFFEYMNFNCIVREDKELAYIKTNDDSVISRINKNETLCLLVLRLLYQEHLDEISLDDDIVITVHELQEKLFSVGFLNQANDRVKKTILADMLLTFKQHNIIYYHDDLSFDNTTIQIYPSIEVAMDFKEMALVLERLEALGRNGEADE